MFSGNLALWNGFRNDTYEPTVDGFLNGTPTTLITWFIS